LQHVLEKKASRTSEEQEFIVAMKKTWEESRTEARTMGLADGLLAVLDVRGISVPDAARQRILAQHDPERLKRWLAKAVVAGSIEDVLAEPS
jgi:hypothetical protein